MPISTQFAKALTSGFASEYAFGVKAQNFHWNTEGRFFYSDHLLLERIYEEVIDSIDDFAENLRKVQLEAPAGFAILDSLSAIDDAAEDAEDGMDPEEMLQELLTDSNTMIDIFRDLFDMAEAAGEHGLSNFLADRQDAHSKHSWFLRSSLKPPRTVQYTTPVRG
jgi:starvation-inducible DNA-binding protein